MKKFESSNTCLPTEFNTVAGLSQSGLIIQECQSQYNLTKNWDLKANFTNDMQSCLVEVGLIKLNKQTKKS